jgi:lipopolysaccharide cholinephosphotransferase
MGEKNYLSLEEIQEIELGMLLDFTAVCEKYNLRYYLCGGTLLGAVRHKGFIPWDDDIDVLMPRPDYLRFLKIAGKKRVLPGHLRVCSNELGNLHDPFCKIENLQVRMEKDYSQDEHDRYLWIDIFPMDGLPDKEWQVKWIYRRVITVRTLIRIFKVRPEISDTVSKTRFRAFLKPLLKPLLNRIGVERLVAYIDRLCRKYDFDSSRYVGGIAFGYGPQERMVRKDYVKPVEVEFEGHLFHAPGCWHQYLTNLYGDYMKMPPKEKRVAHLIKMWREDGNG